MQKTSTKHVAIESGFNLLITANDNNQRIHAVGTLDPSEEEYLLDNTMGGFAKFEVVEGVVNVDGGDYKAEKNRHRLQKRVYRLRVTKPACIFLTYVSTV